jgi:hypothetical protein
MNYTIFSKVGFLFIFLLGFQVCSCQKKSSTDQAALNAVKKILTASTNQSLSVLKDTGSFLINTKMEESLPDELREINSKLEALGLSSIVENEKQNIGKAAQSSVKLLKPIINSAIKDITPLDAASIITGGKGAATQYLKKKTKAKFIAAIQPEVENELDSSGVSTLVNSALNDKSVQNALGIISGNNVSTNENKNKSIANYATSQIVNKFFQVAEEYEVNHSNFSSDLIKSLIR